jgi:hypothetical protein
MYHIMVIQVKEVNGEAPKRMASMTGHNWYESPPATKWWRPGQDRVIRGDGTRPSPSCYAKEDRKEVMPMR